MTTTATAQTNSQEYESLPTERSFPLFTSICAPNEYELNQYDYNMSFPHNNKNWK